MIAAVVPAIETRIQEARRCLLRLHRNLAFRLSRRKNKPDLVRLRVLLGRHSGAQQTYADGAAILVGSSSDCDIALCDPGIAPHHCVFTLHQGGVTARAIDGPVRLERRKHRSPGTACVSTWWRTVLNDDVVLGLGPAADQGWGPVPTVARQPLAVRRRGYAIAAGVAGLTVMTATVAVPRQDPASEIALPVTAIAMPATEAFDATSANVQTVLARLGLGEVEIKAHQDGSAWLYGVVPSATDVDALRLALEQRGVAIELDVRVGEVIARDVREVLRLSGITAKTRYDRAGGVVASGDFPLDEQLSTILASRAMREIDRLVGVTVVNVDGSAKVPPGKNIVAVVRGDDPYVVTADGSRYYVGAVLPNGDILHQINDDEVLVVTGTETRRLDIKESGSESSNTQA